MKNYNNLMVATAVLALIVMTTPAFTQWMRGGMNGRGMGNGRACRIMDVTQQPVDPAALPEPESIGAGILKTKCIQCHGLVSPKQHSSQDWPYIVNRMDQRMQMMSSGRMKMMRNAIVLMSPEDKKVLLQYLQANAFKALQGSTLPASETPGAQAFTQTCSRCHALPDPKSHNLQEWETIVNRMNINSENMGFGPILPEQITALLGYLKSQADSY